MNCKCSKCRQAFAEFNTSNENNENIESKENNIPCSGKIDCKCENCKYIKLNIEFH